MRPQRRVRIRTSTIDSSSTMDACIARFGNILLRRLRRTFTVLDRSSASVLSTTGGSLLLGADAPPLAPAEIPPCEASAGCISANAPFAAL